MKEYEVQISGKTHNVLIKEQVANRFVLVVDGHELQAECEDIPAFAKKFAAKIGSTAYSVSLGALKTDSVVGAVVDGKSFTAAIAVGHKQKETSRFVPTASRREGTSQKDIVCAPVSGLISSIAVSTGQNIRVGQALLVLEAMKMENEIVAPREGTVEAICVSVGAKVSKNDPLIMLA